MIKYRLRGIRKIVLMMENAVFNLWWSRRLGNRVRIFGWPILSVCKGAKISIGKNCVLISDSFFSEPGVAHPVVIRLMNPQASLTLGNNVGISGGGICVQTEVTIGDDVMFGANAFVTDTDFHPLEATSRRFSRRGVQSAPVHVEDNVFLGMNSLVLKGVTIGANSVLGAGSIVTRDIPKNSIAAGTPARPISQVESQS